MKWNHLPMAGGLYDQHPKLIDRFYYIFAEKAKAEEAERKKSDAKMGRSTGSTRPPGNHGRRR